MKEVIIAGRPIGPSFPPFIVAELSGNHMGSLKRALELVEAAKNAGADAVKLQTYTADTITLNSDLEAFRIQDTSSLWCGRWLHELYQEAHTPWEWHKAIFSHCQKLNLIAFSSPFDETAVDFLEGLQVPCYKIASPEIVDLALIRKVASTKKPLILSTGGATLEEIARAVNVARVSGCKELILLKCTAAYPAKPSEMNIKTIAHLKECFDVPVGLSDHSLGIGAALCSVAFGTCLIEKHLTLSRDEGGVDSAFSLEPDEFYQLCRESKAAFESLGKVCYGPIASEKNVCANRPSLYFTSDLPKECVIEAQHLVSLRPSLGLPPQESERLIGLKLASSVKSGEPVTWEVFKYES